jgi:hypothetical protein
MNATLESLGFDKFPLLDESAALWHRAFSFLCINKALKSLIITFDKDVADFCVAAFRIDIAAMLQENTSLENLSIRKFWSSYKMKAEDYIALVTALQHNTMLKTLQFNEGNGMVLQLTDDEDKQMIALLKKN